MSKTRLLVLAGIIALSLGLVGAAEACPSCDAPWLWTATPCKPTNCSPCGWAAICGGGLPLVPPAPTASGELLATVVGCDANADAQAAVIAPPSDDVVVASGDTQG